MSPEAKSSKTASRGEKTSSSSTTKSGGSRNHSQATNGHSSKSSSHKSVAPLPKTRPKPPPVNFGELMKIAQKNLEKPKQQPQQQTQSSGHGERVSKEKGQTLAPPCVNGGQRKTKSVSPTPVKKPIASKDRQQRSRTPTGNKPVVKPSTKTGLASSMPSSKTSNNSRGPQKDQRVPSSNGSIRGRDSGGVTSGSGRGRGRVPPASNPAKANAFYGAASSQLARDERPRFQTKRPSFLPRSSMVGKMSDYMLRLEQERLLREEEDDEYEDEYEDEDDFIDDGDECDYSAAIREIFGYDRSR